MLLLRLDKSHTAAMDMSMSSSMSMPSMTSMAPSVSATSSGMSGMTGMSAMDMMTPYLHFTGGDNLLFKTWTPSSHGAIAGACIGLVALAIFERWIAAMRGILSAHWRRRAFAFTTPLRTSDSGTSTPAQDKKAQEIQEVNINSLSSEYPGPVFSFQRSPRSIEPFLLAHDVPRGALYAFQALLAYALMLSVMTFQAAFIISIVLGLGIGEVLFGRMGSTQNHLLH